MSSYPPPPDPQQFPTLYPPAPSSQLPPNEQEEQIHYTPAVPSSDFSKLEAGASEHNVFASSTHSLDSTQAEGHTKANRLRKACDSCSVRKVKVSLGFSCNGVDYVLSWRAVEVIVMFRLVLGTLIKSSITVQRIADRSISILRCLVRRVWTAMPCLYCSRHSVHIRTTEQTTRST